MLTEINGQRFNVGVIRNRLNYIAGEARDSELRVVAKTADDLIVALLAERTQLRSTLSLAEEGLANYEEEMQARIKLMQQKDAEIAKLRALLTQAPTSSNDG